MNAAVGDGGGRSLWLPGSVRQGVRVVAEGAGRGRGEGGAAAAAALLEGRAAADGRAGERPREGREAARDEGVRAAAGSRSRAAGRQGRRAGRGEKRAPGGRLWLPRAGGRESGAEEGSLRRGGPRSSRVGVSSRPAPRSPAGPGSPPPAVCLDLQPRVSWGSSGS